jgi:molybdate transport system permease protein
MPLLTPLEQEAVLLSLRVAAVAVAASLPPAVLVAWLLARPVLPARLVLAAFVYLPLVLPPVVTGYLLLLGFGRHGPFGAWLEAHLGLVFAFRWTGAALAAAVMAFPLMVRAIQLGFDSVDRRLEQAAATLGAPPLAVFATVSLPLAVPGIAAGALLGFAKSLGEFGATITFVSNIPGETRTLPVAIYGLLQIPGGETAAGRLALLSVLLSLGGLAGSELIARRLRAARP